jgi:SH3-like domain-containing protein
MSLMRRFALTLVCALLFTGAPRLDHDSPTGGWLVIGQASAQDAATKGDSTNKGDSATKGPAARFASLKADRVNVRQGPSRDHSVAWVFTRAGLPVEVTAEFEIWYRIRDSEGAEGWVLKSLVSSRRTALVAPWIKGKSFDLLAKGTADADVRARLEAGVIVTLRECTGTWCRVMIGDVDGWMTQESLWGVYPRESDRYK